MENIRELSTTTQDMEREFYSNMNQDNREFENLEGIEIIDIREIN